MSTEMKLGKVRFHRPTRGIRGDDRPQGAYLTIFVGKHQTARHLRLTVDELLTLSSDAAQAARLLLAEGEDPHPS